MGLGLSLSRICKSMLATIGVALYNRPIVTRYNYNGSYRKLLCGLYRSFVKSALSWTSTMSFGRRSALQRMQSVKLHGVLHTSADIQVRHLAAYG